jgi:CubicO group peptidase (beta-lactamase class C family)/D-alanyl-D-alanine dipeptidase
MITGNRSWKPGFCAALLFLHSALRRQPSAESAHRRRRALVLLLHFSLVCGDLAFGTDTRNINPRSDYSAVVAALTQLIKEEMSQKKLLALSVALVDGQSIVWAQGFGYADPQKKGLASAETVYRVGSVTKLFTAIGVMQLVERGQLDLDAPIQRVLPEFHPQNPFGTPITLRELLSHTSGLPYLPPAGNAFDPASPPLADVVHSLNDTVLIYPPGTRMKYSNAGVSVVAYALERTVGVPFAVYLKRALLSRAGLESSGFECTAEMAPNLAKAFMWTYDGRVFPAPTFNVGIFPAAGMYSTVADLGRFMAVLFDGGHGPRGQVLKPETLRNMWTPGPGQQSSLHFGIGFAIGSLDGHRMVGHNGGIYGFAISLEALPDDQLGAVAVTTMDGSVAVTDRIVQEALRLMVAARSHKPLPEIVTTTAVSLGLARSLEGRYLINAREPFMDLDVRTGRLFMLPVQFGPELELRRLNNTLMVDDRLAYGIKFPLREDAARPGLRYFDRIDVPKPPPAPSEWAGLIGEYGWDHNVLYILEKDAKLTALIEWFAYLPLGRVSDDIFSFPDYGLYDHEKATFVRNAQGYATQVRIGGVVFKRRTLAGGWDSVFHIKPLKPVEELRREALAAHPRHESGEFLKPNLVELVKLDPSIKLEIRYASNRNFLNTPIYQQARAFMQRPAAEAVVRANRHLKALGYGLLVFDAYRPWYVTKILWDAAPDEDHIFLANPAEGSRHNRGCAVDLTLYDLKTGEQVPMVGNFDEMSERSYAFYPGGTSLQRWDRNLLRHAMEAEGFSASDSEWWHFDCKDWRKYPILNLRFEVIGNAK